MSSTDPLSETRLGRLFAGLEGTAGAQFQRVLSATREDVWSAVTDPDRISRWLAPTTIDGDSYRTVYGEGADNAVDGQILECRAPERLVVTWEVSNASPSTVELELSEKDGGTGLRLKHTQLPASSAPGFAAGWEIYLGALTAHLEGAEPAEDWDAGWVRTFPLYAKQLPSGLGHVSQQGERGSLRFQRRLRTDLADAWSVISDPERIARWFAPVTVEGKEWITYWDDGREYATGEILRCEPQRLIEVSWCASDDAEPLAETMLRVTLTPEDDGVRLTLEHEQVLASDLTLYGPGWHIYLDRLPNGDPDLDWSARYTELAPHYQQMFQSDRAE